MRKMKSEMLKTRKKGKTIKLGKNSEKFFRELEKFPRIFGNPGISQVFRDFLKISRFPVSQKPDKKRNPSVVDKI